MIKLGRSGRSEAFFVPELIDVFVAHEIPDKKARLPTVNLRKPLLLIPMNISPVKNTHPDT
jgi:hypothetical protein